MQKYGLVGQTLKHSFSKEYFNHFFKKENINAEYINIEIDDIAKVKEVLSNDYSGLNITIPYKVSILPYIESLSEEAGSIGAINVVSFKNGKSIGHNTDAYGFHQSIKPFLSNCHERAIIFGTGGVSKSVEYVLKKIGIDVIFISRNPKEENHFSYSEVNENMMNACKLLVNCTPVGMFPKNKEFLDIPFQYLTKEHLVIDLIYNPEKTIFLEKAEANEAMILNGKSMLEHQAKKAWEIWSK